MARGGNVRVGFSADTKDLDRGVHRAEQSFASLAKRGAAMGTGFLGAQIGIQSVTNAFTSTIRAAVDSEAAMAKVKKNVDNAGISYDKHAKQIDKVIQAQSRLTGLDDEALAESFSNMVRTTGKLSESFKLNALAADIARTKGTDLAGAQSLLARVYNGAFMGLKRLGIAFEPVTAAQDKLKASTKKATDEQIKAAKETDKLATRQAAIAALQQKFGGQAEAYGKTTAGAQDRFRVAVENLQEKLGGALLPTINRILPKISMFVEQMTDGTGAGGRFADKLKEIASNVTPIVKFFTSHPHLIATAVAAWATYKAAVLVSLAATKAKIAAQFVGLVPKAAASGAASGGAFGTSFTAASSAKIKAFGWKGVGLTIARSIGVIGITLAVTQVLGIKDKSLPGILGAAQRLGHTIGGGVATILGTDPKKKTTTTPSNKGGRSTSGDVRAHGASVRAAGGRFGAFTEAEVASAILAGGSQFDILQANLDIAQTTSSLTDDDRALGLLKAYWQRRKQSARTIGQKAAAAQGLKGITDQIAENRATRDQAVADAKAMQDQITADANASRTVDSTGSGGSLLDAITANTQELKAMRVAQEAANQINASTVAIGLRSATRSLADLMSGEIAGRGLAPRAATAGSGIGARY